MNVAPVDVVPILMELKNEDTDVRHAAEINEVHQWTTGPVIVQETERPLQQRCHQQ